MKRFVCILLALAFCMIFVACTDNGGETPETTNDANAGYRADHTDSPFAQDVSLGDVQDSFGYRPDTVMIEFDGAVSIKLTAEQLGSLELVTVRDDLGTEYEGPSVADVLALAGIEDASTLTIKSSRGLAATTVELSDIDADASIFAVSKGDLVLGLSGSSIKLLLVCVNADGCEFNEIGLPVTVE